MQILSSVSSDFQTLIKHQFPLYFLNELLMSLRNFNENAFHKDLLAVDFKSLISTDVNESVTTICPKHKNGNESV